MSSDDTVVVFRDLDGNWRTGNRSFCAVENISYSPPDNKHLNEETYDYWLENSTSFQSKEDALQFARQIEEREKKNSGGILPEYGVQVIELPPKKGTNHRCVSC